MNKISLFLLDLFFPNRCPVCSNIIAYDEFVCDTCLDKLSAHLSYEGSLCSICGRNVCSGHEESYYSRVISCYSYRGIVRDGIYSLKDNSKNFGYHIGSILADKIKSDIIMSKADYIVPVPMNRKTLRSRGYNQAYVIAREISDKTGIKILNNVLHKKQSKVQHTLNVEDRKKNTSAFYSTMADLRGKKIIICDDVLTTGSTANKCAQLLKESGAEDVYAAVGAITLKEKPLYHKKDENGAMALAE